METGKEGESFDAGLNARASRERRLGVCGTLPTAASAGALSVPEVLECVAVLRLSTSRATAVCSRRSDGSQYKGVSIETLQNKGK